MSVYIPAEAVMSTIKTECVRFKKYKTREDAKLALFDYIEGFYNTKRLHSALENMSPLEYEVKHAAKGVS